MRHDDFSIHGIQIGEAPAANHLVPRRSPRGQRQFVRVPLEWGHRLAGARYTATWTLALHLLRRAFKERRQTIKVANALLASKGVSRRQKWRALRELEAMGLVEVGHHARKSPDITLLYPEEKA